MITTKKLVFGEAEFIAKFPNVQQIMDIESLKQMYTNNSYAIMATSSLKSQIFACDVADMMATFSTLLPTMKEELNIKNWSSIDALLAKKLVDLYKKEFLPWYQPLLNELYKMEEEEEETKS